MSVLFQPILIGKMKVKNRFVRSATQDWLGNEDGSISERSVQLYETLAKNDIGLIITAHSYIQSPLGRASVRQNAIYEDRFINGYRKLADTVHPYGTKLVVQISHAGRQTAPDLEEGLLPLSPSPVPDSTTGITPQEMTEADIRRLIDDFVAAMMRAKSSGCDGVQIHIAHGYMLSQFISPYTNRRSDMWGGSIENRTRILWEIITRGKEQLGNDYPLLAKINSTDGFEGPSYLSVADVVFTVKSLADLGLAAIEISGGIREAKGSMSRTGILRPEQEAYFAATAKAVKKAVDIPVILVGGLRSYAIMEAVVTDDTADMVALSRPFIKEPDLVVRFGNGQTKSSCISCNACFKPDSLQCYYKGGL